MVSRRGVGGREAEAEEAVKTGVTGLALTEDEAAAEEAAAAEALGNSGWWCAARKEDLKPRAEGVGTAL